MKKNWKWILLAAALVLLLAAAGSLYNSLKDSVAVDNLVAAATDVPTQEPTAAPVETTAAPTDAPAESTVEPTAAPTSAATAAPRPAAPDFTVVDENGQEVTLSSFVGKPVVVNFWASWCGPCKSEMPDFQKAWEAYGEEVVFMIVNMTDGSQETVETAKAYVENQGFTFPVYYDTMMEAAMAYGVMSIPATYFIAADGSAIARANGAINLATLERGLGMIME